MGKLERRLELAMPPGMLMVWTLGEPDRSFMLSRRAVWIVEMGRQKLMQFKVPFASIRIGIWTCQLEVKPSFA